MTPTLGSALFQHKPAVLGNFIDNLKEKIGIAKNKRKKLHNVVIQKTWQFKIQENAEV